MTIDELQEHCERVCNPNGKIFFDDKSKSYQEHKLVLDIIEELKCYRNNNDFSEYADKLYETAYAKGFNDGCAKFSVGQDYNDGYKNGIDDFANWLEDKGYLRDDEIDYDWEENSILNTYYMTAEEVIEEYKEQLKKGENNG